MEPQDHRVDHAARFLVRAAITAPSVGNSQPWRFVSRGDALELRFDPSRALWASDPGGREMVISCGAALFNLRLAMRHLGFTPLVRLLPDPFQPDLLAEIRWGRYQRPTPYLEYLYRTMTRRRTHHGPFQVAALRPMLVNELRDIARAERAHLLIVSDDAQLWRLRKLIEAAELTKRTDPRFVAERARLAVANDAKRKGSGRTEVRRSSGEAEDSRAAMSMARLPSPRTLGTVALLATRDDRRFDWLLAGQALQHMLLYATAYQVSAAFHTQPLELSDLRSEIRSEFTGIASPQMVLRLGYSPRWKHTGERRRVDDVLVETG